MKKEIRVIEAFDRFRQEKTFTILFVVDEHIWTKAETSSSVQALETICKLAMDHNGSMLRYTLDTSESL